jgi:hypothetical protein
MVHSRSGATAIAAAGGTNLSTLHGESVFAGTRSRHTAAGANLLLRQIVHTSIGGTKVRVLISNAYGSAPVTAGAGHIALREKGGSIQGESGDTLNFSGRATMTIPAGANVYSDPVNLTVPAMADLAIDLYLPGDTSGAAMFTMHNGAFQTNYISETGNYVGKRTLPNAIEIQNWFLLSRVEVVAPDAAGAIVAFGDSITDGTRSTPDTNNRWPDHLARRLVDQGLKLAVLNAAIAGNRILSEATVPPGVDVRAVAQGVNALAALVQPASRAAFAKLTKQGWVDAVRALHPSEPMYTFWHYLRKSVGARRGSADRPCPAESCCRRPPSGCWRGPRCPR